MRLIEKTEDEVGNKERLIIQELIKKTWPEPGDKILNEKELLNDFETRTPGKTSYLLYQAEELIGYAETFKRKMITSEGPLKVLSLGAVCVDNAYRGQGHGARIIKYIFNNFSTTGTEVCLFQTGVPGFYEKLNSKIVKNQFVNSLNTKDPNTNPFWDEYTMIYPAHYNWPKGKVDIQGKGF